MDSAETPPPVPRACRAFHVSLVATLLFPVAAAGTFVLAVLEVFRADPDPRERLWTRRLVGLALVDGLYALAVVWWINEGQQLIRNAGKRDLPASDLGLFDPIARGFGLADFFWPLVGLLPFVVAAFLTEGRARRAGGSVLRTWGFLLAAFLGGQLAALGTALVLADAFQGRTVGGFLIASLVQILLMGTLAFAGLRGAPATALPPGIPPLGAGRAFLRGLFYIAAGTIRLGLILAAADMSLLGGRGMIENAVVEVASTRLGTGGRALLIVDVVILAPLAEELLFRGFLLPRLASRLGNGWALWASSAVFAGLHAPYGIYTLIVLLDGLVLGWARLRSGGLGAPIALHMAVNLIMTAPFLAN